MIPGRRALAGILLPVVVATACGRERPAPAGDLTRSASASPAFPTDPSTLGAALGVPPDSLAAAAQERYAREAFDSARAIFQVEAARAHGAGDAAAEGRARMWLGLAQWHLGDLPAARREVEAAVILKRRTGLDAELAQAFNAVGLVAWRQGRHREALAQFDSSTVAARRHDDAKGIARAAGNIGLVEVELGDFDAARRGFTAMLLTAHTLGDERYWGNALANLGMLEIHLGNPSAALPLLAEARVHYARIEYATGELNALGHLATAWSGLGEVQRAIAAADSELTLARSLGAQLEVAAALEILADLHVQAGNLRLALARLAEADSLDAQLGQVVERGADLRRSSVILLELGEAGPAVVRAQQALELHRAVEARPEMVRDRLQLALAAAATGNRRRAEAETDSALAEASRIANPAVARDAAMVAAQLALEAGHPQEALRHLSVAAASEADWRVADLRAGSLFALGRLTDARTEAQRSIAALERERASLALGPLRSAYLASRAGPFSRLVAIDLALADTAGAFATAASLPGRGLAERLGGLGESMGSVTALAEGERLLLRAAALEQTLDTLGDRAGVEAQRRSLEAALVAARAAYEEQLASRATQPGDRLFGLAPTSLAATQSRLGADDALLTFLSGPDRLDLFLVRSDRVIHSSVPLGEAALAVRVRLARQMLSVAAQGRPVPAALGELHDLLLGPLIAAGGFDGVSHLLIVPHGALGALPFAALWDRQAGRFLIEDRVVTYLPAVAALGDAQGGVAEGTGPLMVFAPLPDSLPGTAREARTISRLVPGSHVRSGRASSEPGVRAALAAGVSVHLASHGAHNAQNPLFTRVIVGRDGGDASADDGRLEVHEILGLQTASPLVFLSGCETGLGAVGQDPFAQGDDEGSLAQAFLVAGAGAVVATLWRVGDAAAADLAGRFYRGLAMGESPAAALARAQREAIRSRRGADWAAYAVWGTAGRKSTSLVRVTGTEP